MANAALKNAALTAKHQRMAAKHRDENVEACCVPTAHLCNVNLQCAGSLLTETDLHPNKCEGCKDVC